MARKLASCLFIGACLLLLPGTCYAADSDGDGISDKFDNCPNARNPNQQDANDNGAGDVCDERFTPIIPPNLEFSDDKRSDIVVALRTSEGLKFWVVEDAFSVNRTLGDSTSIPFASDLTGANMSYLSVLTPPVKSGFRTVWQTLSPQTGTVLATSFGTIGDILLAGCNFAEHVGTELVVINGHQITIRSFDETKPTYSATMRVRRYRTVLGCGDINGDSFDELLLEGPYGGNRARHLIALNANGSIHLVQKVDGLIGAAVFDDNGDGLPDLLFVKQKRREPPIGTIIRTNGKLIRSFLFPETDRLARGYFPVADAAVYDSLTLREQSTGQLLRLINGKTYVLDGRRLFDNEELVPDRLLLDLRPPTPTPTPGPTKTPTATPSAAPTKSG